jgi:hypothetical protein
MDDAPQYYCNMRSVVMDCGRRSLADGVGVGEGGRRYRSRSRHGAGWEEMEIRNVGEGTYHYATSLANFPTISLCLLSPIHSNFGGVERARGDGSITTLKSII